LARNSPSVRHVYRNVTRFFVCLLAAGMAFGQAPTVGEINLYGLRKVAREKVLAALRVKPGDPLPPSKGDLEDALEELPGVVRASVTAVCCEGSGALLFVGLEERGAPHFASRTEPSGPTRLPDSLLDLYRRFLEAVEAAARQGNAAEDLTRGHSAMADPAAAALQLEFAAYAPRHVAELREVLRTSGDADHRAIAATVIGYAERKSEVVDDLQFAMQDPDEAVRANAMRSLTAFSVLAAKDRESGIRVSPTWFIEMLNSVVLSDRLKAAEALLILTERNQPAIDAVRERALGALVEMARWKSLRYALPAFVLAGRVAGLPEQEIQARWEKGERESVLDSALAAKPKRRS
jgi:hypothetical protein